MAKSDTKKVLETAVVAKYFGFDFYSKLDVTKEDIEATETFEKKKESQDETLFPIEEAIALARKTKEDKRKDSIEPTLCYLEGGANGKHKKHHKRANSEIISLHILDISGSIAEALMIKATESILSDNGVKKIVVKINSIGDKDAQALYMREATNYYKKSSSGLTGYCKQLFKEGTHSLVTRGQNQCAYIHNDAPKPMEFLDEGSRKHFGEVLEYLETLDIPYEIDNSLLGNPTFSTHTVFQIIDTTTDKVVASGCRYNALAKKFGPQKDSTGLGVIIHVPTPKTVTVRSINKVEESDVYFLQIGYEAKLKSLVIIDELRKANVPVRHKLYRDRLSTQISSAKKSGAGYFIIMGQREAMSDELIVRDKESRSQSLVPRKTLVDFLKNL